MTTEALCKLAAALQIFLAEQTYIRQIQERVETLAQVGLSLSHDELSKVGGDMNATRRKTFQKP